MSEPVWLPEAAKATRELLERLKPIGFEDNRSCGVTHCVRLCQKIESGEVRGAKAHRFLGWAQCAVVSHGLAELPKMRDINRTAIGNAVALKPSFQPTHKHAEGGLYRVVSPDRVKMKIGDHWRKAVLYCDEAGNRYVRAEEDFEARFTPVELKA